MIINNVRRLNLLHLSIAKAYDTMADRWRNDLFGRTDGLCQHRQALAFLGSKHEGWALNVGCGCSTRFNALLGGSISFRIQARMKVRP